jgi:hypothetical protein
MTPWFVLPLPIQATPELDALEAVLALDADVVEELVLDVLEELAPAPPVPPVPPLDVLEELAPAPPVPPVEPPCPLWVPPPPPPVGEQAWVIPTRVTPSAQPVTLELFMRTTVMLGLPQAIGSFIPRSRRRHGTSTRSRCTPPWASPPWC